MRPRPARRRRNPSRPAPVSAADAQLTTILDGLPLAVMLRAQDGRLLHANPGVERFVARLGVGVDAVAPSPVSLMDHIEVIDEEGQPYQPARLPVVSSLRDVSHTDATVGFVLPQGGYAWYRVRAAPVDLQDGTTGTVVTLDDVTDQQEARTRVVVAERSLRLTVDLAPIGIAIVGPDGDLLQVNAALCELVGHAEAALLAGGLEVILHPEERDGHADDLALWLSGAQDRYLSERRFRHATGRVIPGQMSSALVSTDDGQPLHVVVQVVDLSEHHAREQHLRAAAIEDPLTGLGNRRALEARLAVAQRVRDREGGGIGLLYLDLDGFKAVNDTHGHAVGDEVLIGTGQRLLDATRDVDLVCRLGGDEFVVVCAPLDDSEALEDLIDRLGSVPPVIVGDGDTASVIGWSIGAIMVRPEEPADSALRRADEAMYAAKRDRRDAGGRGEAVAGSSDIRR